MSAVRLSFDDPCILIVVIAKLTPPPPSFLTQQPHRFYVLLMGLNQ